MKKSSTPHVGAIAHHKDGLDPRVVAAVSDDSEQIRLDLLGFLSDWVPAKNYGYTPGPAKILGYLESYRQSMDAYDAAVDDAKDHGYDSPAAKDYEYRDDAAVEFADVAETWIRLALEVLSPRDLAEIDRRHRALSHPETAEPKENE